MSRFPRRPGSDTGGKAAARYWDVDVARGVAMAMVVLYHLVFDLDNFGGYPVDSTGGFWAIFADTSAFAFVFLAGLSLSISHVRDREAGLEGWGLFAKYLWRGARIFLWGMLITAVFLALSYGYVIFGILHLIGLSVVLAYPFLGMRFTNLVLGLTLVAAGLYVRAQGFVAEGVPGILLAPLGVLPEGLLMPDYRPLLPWFGVLLLGLFFGNTFYPARAKRSPPPLPPPAAPAAFVGRHTLFIYLVHQPVLLATLWALGIVRF